MSREPVEVRAPEGARLLEVVWNDGQSSLLSHRVLRGFCPCAVCQGHAGPVTWVEATDALGDEGLTLADLAPSGQYALRMSWADGHATGIYTFDYLAELGELFALDPEAQRAKSFGR